MIRLIAIFLLILIAGWSTTWVLDRPGEMLITWQGWEIRTSVAFAALTLTFFVLFLVVMSRVFFGLLRMPRNIARQNQARAKERGLEAISKGLIAIATGDQQLAKRYARQARTLLPDQPLTQVLLAQKAQIEGNDAEAAEHFQQMTKSPVTELLGRQGLIQHAINMGDKETALEHAQRAFELRPKVKWAYQALLDHQSKTNAWDRALATVERGRQSGHISNEDAKFKKAVFLTAKAYAALEQDKSDEAQTLASRAQRLIPGFTPAAILVARLLLESNNQWKASGILEEAWRAQPHPAIIETYATIKPDETVQMRARRLMGLVEMHPEHIESQLLRIRININTKEWGKAREAIAPLIEHNPTPRICALMAEIEQGESNNIGAAREWMARAVSAPSEPEWLRTDFRFTASEWGELSRELTQWPPTFSERSFEKTIRLAPIHDHSKLLEDDAELSERLTPDATASPQEISSLDRAGGDTGSEALSHNQLIISPLRSKQNKGGLLINQPSQAEMTAWETVENKSQKQQKAKPVRKKAASKSKTTTPGTIPKPQSNVKQEKTEQKAIFSLPHQPDDPGPAD